MRFESHIHTKLFPFCLLLAGEFSSADKTDDLTKATAMQGIVLFAL